MLVLRATIGRMPPDWTPWSAPGATPIEQRDVTAEGGSWAEARARLTEATPAGWRTLCVVVAVR